MTAAVLYGKENLRIESVDIPEIGRGDVLVRVRAALTCGFQGKMCIHPNQVAIVNRVFTPSDDEIAFAERVVAAFEKAEAEGVASIQLDGKFIDYPIVYRAQRALEKATAIGTRVRRS